MATKKPELDVKKVETVAEGLLEKMGTAAKVSASVDGDSVLLDIQTEEHKGLLIGSRGETLAAFQTILNLLLRNETGEWQNVVVNIGDWREKQEDYLVSLAKQAASRAVETGRPQNLYNLSASQRRVVHTYLAEDPTVDSFSEGEGRERYLVIRAKEENDSSEKES